MCLTLTHRIYIMRIVKVNATASTNTYLREFYRNTDLGEEVLLWTDHQYAGRGQRGASWESQAFKNLTFSVYKRVKGLRLNQQPFIIMAASLAIYELLETLQLQRIAVKWPNDILAGNRKLCGILVESIINNNKLNAVIIGVGLNVNQTHFKHAPQASSLKLETEKDYDLEFLIQNIKKLFQNYVNRIAKGDFDQIKTDYERRLFKKDKAAQFEDPSGIKFTGIIRGVSPTGELIVQQEDDLLYKYRNKEIRMLY